MNFSKLTKLAWVFFALAVTSTTLFAQGLGNRKQAGNGQNNNCINQLSGLTNEQKTKIDGLNEAHQSKMDELRTKRQAANDAIEKSEIRTTMLKNVKVHRDEVKSLLTAEQQKEYDLLQARGNYGNGRVQENFQGCGRGKGNCQFTGNYETRGNRNGGGQGYGRGNWRNQGCFRN